MPGRMSRTFRLGSARAYVEQDAETAWAWLQARGLVERVADPADRRALHIHLTQAGVALWSDVDQCGLRVRERAMAGMSDDERDLLMRMLVQVRDNLLLTDR